MKSIHTNEYQMFLERLVRARKEQNVTQVQLATLLKKPQSYVSKYENGERRLDVIETMEIARALQINLNLLLPTNE